MLPTTSAEPAEMPRLYAVWHETTPPLPRSRLYRLTPLGLSTPLVESLTSYLKRLADAHLLTVTRLLQHEVLPCVRAAQAQATGQPVRGEIWWRKETVNQLGRRLNGLSPTTAQWVQALETLTGQAALRWLTLLDWQAVLFNQKLLSALPRWCPRCFADWRDAGQPLYEPLLWQIAPVLICAPHQQRLQSQCPYCQQQGMIFSARSRPGYCSRCGHWLGLRQPHDPPALTGFTPDEGTKQNWTTDHFGALLAASPTLAAPPRPEALAQFIAQQRALRPDLTWTAFGRTLGVDHSVINTWQRPAFRLHIESLLHLCARWQVSPLQMITGAARPPTATVSTEKAASPTQRSRWHATPELLAQLRQTMLAALTTTPPPALRAVARQLQLASRTLLYHEPELSAQIGAAQR